MAKTDEKKKARRGPSREATDLMVGDLQTFAWEYEEDRKTLRWAVAIAVVFHVIILSYKLPQIVDNTQNVQQKPKVYVVQQVRFRPPPPPEKQEIKPQQRAKKIPIPDPTPDEPEPIRVPEEIQPDVNIPQTDVIFDIPEGPPPAEPEGPIQVGGDVKPPEKILAPQPQYSEVARKARVQGVVIVQAIIDKEGNVTNVKILKGLPFGLDQSAADAIKKWKFKPATLNGKPVAVYYNLTVNFTLQYAANGISGVAQGAPATGYHPAGFRLGENRNVLPQERGGKRRDLPPERSDRPCTSGRLDGRRGGLRARHLARG
jgi:periplasmic protein TonB